MEECDITILTPVYNRYKEIQKLYKSLVKQTNKNFIWMVIDDGSTDDLERILEQFIKEKKIIIKYYKKINGGKHTAINYGVNKIKTKLTYMVDSDDWLLPDAIQTLYDYYNKYKYKNNICGFNFLRQFPNGEINGEKFPENEMEGSYIEVRINKKITGDKTTMFYTHVLREYPFPEFENEKFLGEDIAWMQMSFFYKMIYVNKSIYVGEYLDTGLTKNRRKNNIEAPNGSSYRGEILMNEKCNIKTRLKGAISYIVYGKFAKKSMRYLVKKSKYKILVMVSTIPANILYLFWNYKYKKGEF